MGRPRTADTLHHPFGHCSLHNNVQGLGRSAMGGSVTMPTDAGKNQF